MATSLRLFQVRLYEEHLEEASFLYGQCRALLLRQEISWLQLGAFEERLEAHIDALMVGEKLALEVCRRRAVEGDVGELFAAVSVFCRYAEASVLASLLRDLDYSDAERSQAVADALKHELPDAWREHCLHAISQGDGPLLSVLGAVVGHRRLPQAGVLLSALERLSSPAEHRALLWAIGRTRPKGAAAAIRPFLQSTARPVRDAALRALLRLNDPEVAGYLYGLADAPECPHVELGLAGGRSVVSALVEAARAPGASPDVVIALGLLGDLAAVRPLIGLLTVEPLAQSAAEALYVITGALLSSDVRIPETMTEDEMFDDELTVFRQTGAVPGRGDGQPYVSNERRLSRDPSAWTDWLEANAARFSLDRRYRLGQPYDPTVLQQCLSSAHYPQSWRGLAAEELLVRYGTDLPFETDMPVVQQIRVLRDAAAAVAQVARTVEPGCWYVGGRLV